MTFYAEHLSHEITHQEFKSLLCEKRCSVGIPVVLKESNYRKEKQQEMKKEK